MSDRLSLITQRGRLSTQELCRIGLNLSCHHLDQVWTQYLLEAYTRRDLKKMQEGLRLSSKALALTYHQLLSPIEWDFWLALRSWNPDPFREDEELAHSATEITTVR